MSLPRFIWNEGCPEAFAASRPNRAWNASPAELRSSRMRVSSVRLAKNMLLVRRSEFRMRLLARRERTSSESRGYLGVRVRPLEARAAASLPVGSVGRAFAARTAGTEHRSLLAVSATSGCS